jgi:hypothetical protein
MVMPVLLRAACSGPPGVNVTGASVAVIEVTLSSDDRPEMSDAVSVSMFAAVSTMSKTVFGGICEGSCS